MKSNYKPVDILYQLAEESSIVLLSGGGFQGPEWSIRISLANLNDEAYSKIGEALHRILNQYLNRWKSEENIDKARKTIYTKHIGNERNNNSSRVVEGLAQ